MAPIDLARFQDFSDGTPEGVRQLCAMFLEHLTETFAVLGAAVAARHPEVLRVEAHKAAGTAGACGARRLSELLTAMETLAADGRVEQAAALMPDVEDEVARVREALTTGMDAATSRRGDDEKDFG